VIRNHCKKSVYSYTLKFQEFPEDELLHCPSKDAVESQFMSMLKEADSLKHKSQVINSMQKKDHKQIWTALIHGIYLLSWSVQKKNRKNLGPSWPWSYGSWIYNYLCNQCLSPLMLWFRISIRASRPLHYHIF
jgi:hypothetical protein